MRDRHSKTTTTTTATPPKPSSEHVGAGDFFLPSSSEVRVCDVEYSKRREKVKKKKRRSPKIARTEGEAGAREELKGGTVSLQAKLQ